MSSEWSARLELDLPDPIAFLVVRRPRCLRRFFPPSSCCSPWGRQRKRHSPAVTKVAPVAKKRRPAATSDDKASAPSPKRAFLLSLSQWQASTCNRQLPVLSVAIERQRRCRRPPASSSTTAKGVGRCSSPRLATAASSARTAPKSVRRSNRATAATRELSAGSSVEICARRR